MNHYKCSVAMLFIVSTLIQSCAVSYGHNYQNSFSKISSKPCIQKWEGVYMFFDGEELPFSYEKIGYVETASPNNSDANRSFDNLKTMAWNSCANGIIAIDNAYKTREYGNYFVEDSEEIYSSQVFSGIAVKIDIDSAFISQYGYVRDTSFVHRVEADHYLLAKKERRQVTNSVLLTLILTGIFALALSQPSEE